jgi:hypothetical protein
MFRTLLLVGVWALAGCATQQQKSINEAYVSQAESANRARAESVKACSLSTQVAECMLGVGLAFASGANAAPLPVVQSDLSAITGFAQAIVPGAVAIRQSVDNRAVALGAQTAQTAQSAQQWGAIGGIVRDTTQAQSATANGAVNAIAGVSIAASNNSSATASAYAQTLGLGFLALPNLVPSITAGGNVVQGDGNDFSNDVRRDTLTAGTELRQQSPSLIDMSQLVWQCTTGNAGNGAAASGGAQNQVCSWVPR